ncbi:hypothetical protein BDY19DRAFT_907136 [Irpex rosettiformis]|uniref:Uncharacterized protein n=1 Tax=Irpex rosettiformis TaxID=378272 RepID=A0ACB8U077_9APHY|nr:hypothetical protein BDY19DRAFT_907136 [Irpex rosettiformis]
MAQLTTKDSTALVCTLWPRGLPQYVKGSYDLGQLYEQRRVVPRHEDAFRDWCYIATDCEQEDKTRCKFLAYMGVNTDYAEEVSVRMQGFVQAVHLGVYGTWNGTSSQGKVIEAVQAITLGGGCARAVFNVQMEAVTALRRFASEQVGGRYEGKRTPKQIEFTAPVFRKVHPTETEYVLPPADPMNNYVTQATAMRREWAVVNGVRIGVQEQNVVRRASAMEIRKGDFVDVTATLSIRVKRQYNSKQVYVTFKPIQVVRLATAAIVKNVVVEKTLQTEDMMNTEGDRAGPSLTITRPRKIAPQVDTDL